MRFVINEYSGEVEDINVLYALNAKKEPGALLPPVTKKTAPDTDSVISIADLLDLVNRYFPDVLPESVLRHYGHTSRPDGELGKSVLFQMSADSARDVEYSEHDKHITVEDLNAIRSIGRKSINEFTSEDIKKSRKRAYKFYKESGVKSPFFRAWFGDWRVYDNTSYSPVNTPAYQKSHPEKLIIMT